MSKFKSNYSLLVLALLSLILVWPLSLPGYFSHHDNLQVMRIYEMRQCLVDGQIPCRWVADMGFGNGFPLFNYYGVLPYYLGALISFVTGYLIAAKLLFFIPLVVAGFWMYLLVKELYGELPGLTAGVVFLFSPYRAVDSYIRGAIAESFAIALIPLVLWTFLKLIRQKSWSYVGVTAFSLTLFLISHNIMTLFFLPVIIGWIGVLLLTESNFKDSLLKTLAAFGLGVAMASFFLLPAFVEKSLVQTETLTRLDLDFRAHFVTVGQLFWNRQWGYGASIPGPADSLSFQIGWPLWWLVVGAVIAMARLRFSRKTWLATFLMLVFGGSVIMMHNRSAFIWEAISLLQYAQFPWRFLSLAIVSGAVLSGYLIAQLPKRLATLVVILVIVATVLLNASYFKPANFYPDQTEDKLLTGALWEEQQRAAILDYLPRTAAEPLEGAPSGPLVVAGKAEITNFEKRSNRWSFDVTAEQLSEIELPIFDFPSWQVRVNNQLISHHHQNHLGRLQFGIPAGSYKVTGVFENTPIRTTANTISLLAVILTAGLLAYAKVSKTSR